MPLFECQKCGRVSNTSSTSPRCTDKKCSSPDVVCVTESRMVELEEMQTKAKFEAQTRINTERMNKNDNSLESVAKEAMEMVKQKAAVRNNSDDDFDAELVKIARRMGKIYALNALAQGKMIDVEGKHADIVGEVMQSLKESNENMADALADVKAQEIEQHTQDVDQQKGDIVTQIVQFAKENPEVVKNLFESLKKSD